MKDAIIEDLKNGVIRYLGRRCFNSMTEDYFEDWAKRIENHYPKDTLRGHKTEHNGAEFVYSDTKESTIKTHKSRPCGKCGQFPTKEGHDNCLGELEDVMNACCGHGQDNEAYIQFFDSSDIRGAENVNKWIFSKQKHQKVRL